ncbi:MAG TPA: NAD(P)/FAD-dependent oxidoreductase [Acidimicrobiales bacterium]|nr:NAD(P)/FAD-dependent oxidoreductase [Acidimicrobiales bacterium]
MVDVDAVVVGAGPNGLAAAVALARAGRSVVVLEAADTVGGGARSEELTLPGFVHDTCSAVHPLGAGSPFLSDLPLADHGLSWAHSELACAHPLPDGSAAVLGPSLGETAAGLGADARAWSRLFGPLVRDWEPLRDTFLAPLLRVPSHPLVLARFGLRAVWPASALARGAFRGEAARALFAGLSAHAILDLGHPLTSAFGFVLGAAAHAVGWPVARGGSQRIAGALASLLEDLGGEIVTGHPVRALDDLPPASTVLFDLTPRQVLAIAGDDLPSLYRRRLQRFRYGPGSFKIDYALDAPVPWRAEACTRAATVHLGGPLDEVVASERDVTRGRHPERPFVLVAQPTICDPTRAPAGRHTLWAYCHVPHGSTVDMTTAVEDQIERFAPGFRDRVLARHVTFPADFERHDANLVGGDIAAGSHGGLQLVGRPVLSFNPYTLPLEGRKAFLCSASTPPGAGVHGMCGWWAAHAALL